MVNLFHVFTVFLNPPLLLLISSFSHDHLSPPCVLPCVMALASSSCSPSAYCLCVKPLCSGFLSHPSPQALCRHPSHFSSTRVQAGVVSKLSVQSIAGNFLLISRWAIPHILGMFTGAAGVPRGACNTRQALKRTNIIRTVSNEVGQRD